MLRAESLPIRLNLTEIRCELARRKGPDICCIRNRLRPMPRSCTSHCLSRSVFFVCARSLPASLLILKHAFLCSSSTAAVGSSRYTRMVGQGVELVREGQVLRASPSVPGHCRCGRCASLSKRGPKDLDAELAKKAGAQVRRA